MFKNKIEKMPLCIDCKNCYSVKSKLSNGIEVKCDTYCRCDKKNVIYYNPTVKGKKNYIYTEEC